MRVTAGQLSAVPIGRRSILVGMSILIAACSFDYTSGTAEALLAEVPDTILHNVSHVVVRDGAIIAEIDSARLENFSADQLSVLTNVTYREFDRNGNLTNHGRADRATIHTETDDAEVSGTIQLRSETQEATISAGQLVWDDDARTLTSPPQDLVELKRDDGSQVSGRGLEILVRRRTLRFAGRVDGTIVADE